MDALIIVAHGSKLKSSNDEVISIVNKIKQNIENDELLVFYSFLELTEPSIFISINKAIAENCKKIKIFPYFLAAGKHVKEDIPCEIKKFKKKYPEIEFVLLPHIGECKGIEEMIISNI
uniref:sirohydrochlorin chelatase n=1 Tax=Aliarcobacter sp. TaxID=2321116 RepID=UPI0040482018